MSKKVERVQSSLQLEENINLQIKGWILQRIGWGLMFIVLAAAALGAFGDGLLSKQSLTEEGTTLTFERFARREAETQIEVFTPNRNGNITLTLSPEFTAAFKIENIMPEPQEQVVKNGATIYQFPADGRGQLVLFLSARKPGSLRSVIEINTTEFVLEQYIYP